MRFISNPPRVILSSQNAAEKPPKNQLEKPVFSGIMLIQVFDSVSSG